MQKNKAYGYLGAILFAMTSLGFSQVANAGGCYSMQDTIFEVDLQDNNQPARQMLSPLSSFSHDQYQIFGSDSGSIINQVNSPNALMNSTDTDPNLIYSQHFGYAWIFQFCGNIINGSGGEGSTAMVAILGGGQSNAEIPLGWYEFTAVKASQAPKYQFLGPLAN